jgi:hypothetical protein
MYVPALTPAERVYIAGVYRKSIRVAETVIAEGERLKNADMLAYGRELLAIGMEKLSAVLGVNNAGPH